MKSKVKKLFSSDAARIVCATVLFLPALILELLGVEIVAVILYALALLVAGAPVFIAAARGILRRDLFDEKFLMSVASIGAMVIGEFSEGVAVMLFFLVGEAFEHRAVRRSRTSIRSLMEIYPDEATIITDGKEIKVDAEDVEVGAIIAVRPGERVPVDCTVLEGSADIDTSSMTGEAMPRGVGVGDSLDSGVVVLNGLLICKAQRPAEDSAAARVLALVENASENKSREESFITKFSRIYTPTVVILALLLALLPPIVGLLGWSEAVYRALIFLVISCPCALVISVPMAFFGGIGGAASRGILFKGGNVFSKLKSADTVVLDKTGTVTGGEFTIVSAESFGTSREEMMSLAASAEYASNHPIAIAIKAVSKDYIHPTDVREIFGEGIVATVDSHEIAVGNPQLMARIGAESGESEPGTVFVARDGILIGTITLKDELKPEARSAMAEMRKLGVRRLAMLSGDRRENAEHVGAQLGIDYTEGELTPEEKYDRLLKIISESEGGTMYVGDGINDAPALARADVGIAMGAIGQDAAIEAADLVLMTDNLDRIPEAILIARKTLRIAKENIFFALFVKLSVMLLGALGFANMWLAVFADVGVAVLAILNSMRALRAPKIEKSPRCG